MAKRKQIQDDLITVQEAAKLRGVSKARVHQWIAGGRLRKEVKYGRVLVDRHDVMSITALPAGRPRKTKT
jgi:excisionase family DNA binding protein